MKQIKDSLGHVVCGNDMSEYKKLNSTAKYQYLNNVSLNWTYVLFERIS
jgi:hypothetical protein